MASFRARVPDRVAGRQSTNEREYDLPGSVTADSDSCWGPPTEIAAKGGPASLLLLLSREVGLPGMSERQVALNCTPSCRCL